MITLTFDLPLGISIDDLQKTLDIIIKGYPELSFNEIQRDHPTHDSQLEIIIPEDFSQQELLYLGSVLGKTVVVSLQKK